MVHVHHGQRFNEHDVHTLQRPLSP